MEGWNRRIIKGMKKKGRWMEGQEDKWMRDAAAMEEVGGLKKKKTLWGIYGP